MHALLGSIVETVQCRSGGHGYLDRLEGLEGEVTLERLVEMGLVGKGQSVKILGAGEISQALNIQAHKFSKSAKAKIEAAGGKCEVIDK